MFGVATVKRTKSLDTPSNVTNQIQSFDDNMSDNDPYNQKENFTSYDNLWLNDEYCHGNIAESHSVKPLHDSNTGCHTMVTRTGGIKKNVQLFNSPYMDDKEGDSPAVVWSSKKRKTTSDTITMATGAGTIVTRSRPSRNNSCYGNKVCISYTVTTLVNTLGLKAL